MNSRFNSTAMNAKKNLLWDLYKQFKSLNLFRSFEIPEFINDKKNLSVSICHEDTFQDNQFLMFVGRHTLADAFVSSSFEEYQTEHISKKTGLPIGSFNNLLDNYSEQFYSGVFHLGINPVNLKVLDSSVDCEFIGEHSYVLDIEDPSWIHDDRSLVYWLFQVFSAIWEMKFRELHDIYIQKHTSTSDDDIEMISTSSVYNILLSYTAKNLDKAVPSKLIDCEELFNFGLSKKERKDELYNDISYHFTDFEFSGLDIPEFIDSVFSESFIQSVPLWYDYLQDVIEIYVNLNKNLHEKTRVF